jgi:malonyl-CoA O-methyltransferase
VPDSRVTWITGDTRLTWPVADASVDVIVGNLVLEHVGDLAPVYASAHRVLRPGGLLYLCELHPYRQLRGGQAHFTDAATGTVVHVPAHVHSVSEYVNGGLAAGLALVQLGEWHDRDAQGRTPDTAPPRLLSILFQRG